MTKFILCLVFISSASYANDAKKVCNPVSSKYHDGENPSHEVRVSNRTVIVGGSGEVYAENMDHLAVQRGLINCASKVLDCFEKEKTSWPKEFKVTFDISPSGEIANASNFQFSWNNKQNKQIDDCISKVWSETKYGLIIKETKKVSMPIQIK